MSRVELVEHVREKDFFFFSAGGVLPMFFFRKQPLRSGNLNKNEAPCCPFRFLTYPGSPSPPPLPDPIVGNFQVDSCMMKSWQSVLGMNGCFACLLE